MAKRVCKSKTSNFLCFGFPIFLDFCPNFNMDDGMELFKEFVDTHKPQLLASGVPEVFWEQLYVKLKHQVFDAGNTFSLLLVDYGDDQRSVEDPVWTVAISKEGGIKFSDPNEIYLIDHAWTFRSNSMKHQLNEVPTLVNRLAIMMGIDQEDMPYSICVNEIMKNVWKYANMYSLNADGISVENRMPIWYIMDELGSGIRHSEEPNVRVIPFIYIPEQVTYSLLFPIADIEEGDQIFRDFVEGVPSEGLLRDALLLPWKYISFAGKSFRQQEPTKEYFLEGHIEESLPDPETAPPLIDGNRPLKVYSDYSFVCNYLNDPAFEIVQHQEEADILWLTKHFKGYLEFSENSPNRFINQFPFENVLTIKDLLSIVCRRVASKENDPDNLAPNPKWLPITYNLKTELLEFISCFQNRTCKRMDNHWIVKPWNLARGLDMNITNSLSQIIRLQPTGPKIAQKYIEKPVLFERSEVDGKVKFDIRYVILLKSVDELDAYIYSNFFLRFANKPFELNDFEDYEKHFTVMNYVPEFQLRHMKCDEFLEDWKQQYPKFEWSKIEQEICQMFKEVLLGATKKSPPCGIGANPQSRALYAADLMLEWTEDEQKMQPKILEINWTPDCKRACEYYPDFYNDIFNLLFLDQENCNVFKKIV